MKIDTMSFFLTTTCVAARCGVPAGLAFFSSEEGLDHRVFLLCESARRTTISCRKERQHKKIT
ncbi:unnamed protein product [Ectocarpus sp. 4 AP-2014]